MKFKLNALKDFFTIFILISASISAFTLLSNATQVCTVRGYVYIDETIQNPDEILLSFPDQNITAVLANNTVGYFIIDFDEDIGETGIFYVSVDGEKYIAKENITVEFSVHLYRINLTINTTQEINNPPEVEITKPKASTIYFREREIQLDILENTLIFGNITIEINATDIDDGIDKVELKIEGMLREETVTLDEYPYQYNWNNLGFGRYIITAIAYDTKGELSEDSISVLKFF